MAAWAKLFAECCAWGAKENGGTSHHWKKNNLLLQTTEIPTPFLASYLGGYKSQVPWVFHAVFWSNFKILMLNKRTLRLLERNLVNFLNSKLTLPVLVGKPAKASKAWNGILKQQFTLSLETWNSVCGPINYLPEFLPATVCRNLFHEKVIMVKVRKGDNLVSCLQQRVKRFFPVQVKSH